MIDLQTIIVGLILIAAAIYAGTMLRRKADAFSTKSDCGDNCGCSAGSAKPKRALD